MVVPGGGGLHVAVLLWLVARGQGDRTARTRCDREGQQVERRRVLQEAGLRVDQRSGADEEDHVPVVVAVLTARHGLSSGRCECQEWKGCEQEDRCTEWMLHRGLALVGGECAVRQNA